MACRIPQSVDIIDIIIPKLSFVVCKSTFRNYVDYKGQTQCFQTVVANTVKVFIYLVCQNNQGKKMDMLRQDVSICPNDIFFSWGISSLKQCTYNINTCMQIVPDDFCAQHRSRQVCASSHSCQDLYCSHLV